MNVRDSHKSTSEYKRGRRLRSHLRKDGDGYLPAFIRENCCITISGIYTSVEFTQT